MSKKWGAMLPLGWYSNAPPLRNQFVLSVIGSGVPTHAGEMLLALAVAATNKVVAIPSIMSVIRIASSLVYRPNRSSELWRRRPALAQFVSKGRARGKPGAHSAGTRKDRGARATEGRWDPAGVAGVSA